MPHSTVPTVMISSTARDLPAHRAAAQRACMGLGLHPVMMEHLPAVDADAIDASLKMVDDSTVYLGIFAFRYGYVPDDAAKNPGKLGITEMEYERARDLKRPRLLFVATEDHPDLEREAGEGADKLARFKDRILKERVVKFFTSPAQLEAQITQALANWLELRLPWHPEPPGDPDALSDRGELPPGSRLLDMRPNPYFVGRERDMLALARLLLHDDGGAAVITPAAAATGAGGIGKTQLAVEFAHRYGRCFYGVHWLNLQGITDDDPSRADAEIAACGQAMNLPGFPETQPEQVALTLETWHKSSPRLVILDNAEKPAAVQAVLGRLPAGQCVLVTSRWDREGQWRDIGVRPAGLDVLDRAESRALLRGIAEQLKAVPDAELDTLAERLGDYPLALDLAAHYLRDTGLSVADYLAALDGLGNILEHRSLKTWAAEAENANPTRHDTDVARTFALSWERVTNPQARDLFLACGYLAPNEPIPDDLLLALMDDDAEALALARGQLSGAGLLRAEPSQIHTLLAAFARAQEGAGERLPVVAHALASLSYDANKAGLQASFAPLRAHMEITAAYADTADLGEVASLWGNLGFHLNVIADYPNARLYLEQALAVDERFFGLSHPNTAHDVYNLGKLFHNLGDLHAARTQFERALAIYERVLEPDHPNIAAAANDLGMLLQNLGDLPAAFVHLERALSVYERYYGPEDPNVSVAANNFGLLLHYLGDQLAARAYLERALAIDERVYGLVHPKVATVANNLGLVLKALGNLPAARAYAERALSIDEREYGLDHPSVARDLSNLGMVLRALGDLSTAYDYYMRALAIDERLYGPNHQKLAVRASHLGNVLHDMGDLPAARVHYEHALAISERVYGPDHPNVATDSYNLGCLCLTEGDLAGTRAWWQRALRIRESTLPSDHPKIQIVRRNLAMLDKLKLGE